VKNNDNTPKPRDQASAPVGPMGGRGPMGGGPMAMMSRGEKARDFKGTLKKLIQYIGRYKLLILFIWILAIASTIASIVGPKILGNATTKLFEGVMAQISGTGSIDFIFIENILLEVLLLYLLSAALSYIQGWIMTNVAMDITYRFRKDIAQKINRLPLKYFDSTNHGEVLSRVTNDVDTVNQTLNQSLTQIITSIVTVLGVLVMMLTISWQMTLVALVILPISFGIIALIIGKSQVFFKRQQDYLGHINGHVEEMYGGHVVMKAFNGEAKSVEQFDQINNTLFDSSWKSQFLTGLLFPIMNFVGNLSYVFICILGGYLAVAGAITLGDIQAFIQYVRSFTQPIAQIANISNTLQQTMAAAERVFQFLAEVEETPDIAVPVVMGKVEGRVDFKNVLFGYSPDKIIINDFSFYAEPGQKIAIVGPTGAGKTTMVKLLMRFYDVTSGAILVDGHNVKDFKRSDLRGMFGMVLQDTWLYNGTIMENIRYGRSNATDDEVIAAARAAHADYFIRALPSGYDFVLNEETTNITGPDAAAFVLNEETTNISQGQMQLLTIARAILADPAILILDEATSSVDTRTEVLIQGAMLDLMKNRTSFVIAHRLSTIREADWILVMKDGGIVEQGKHEKLLAKKGVYADLYNSQFEGIKI
jgi:ATP-binding cassette subfamily B multidrug efflux pump